MNGNAREEFGWRTVCLRSPTRTTQAFGDCCPAGVWDTHAHVIETPPKFPWVGPRGYDPPEATLHAYLALLDTLGLQSGVLVQVSVHGTDNSALLSALQACPGRLRGVAVVSRDVSDAELTWMHAAGVRGVLILKALPGGVPLHAAAPLAERIVQLGWHIQFALQGHELVANLDSLLRLPVPLVIDHFGGCDPAEGPGAQFQALLKLLNNDNCYVKLSGKYRMARPSWQAMQPLAKALIESCPNKVLWGSDWPHVALIDADEVPQTHALLELLTGWSDDMESQPMILVENPVRLYGRPEDIQAA